MKPNYRNKQADEGYQKIAANLQALPFCFTYDETEYKGISSPFFQKENRQIGTEGDKETKTVTGRFAQQLRIPLILMHYYSHGATEWTVWFENTSEQNSALLASTGACRFYIPAVKRPRAF